MTKCIVLICGPPACLKSTLVKILRLIFNDQQILKLNFLCIKKFYEILFKKIEIQYNFLSFDDLFFGYENDIIENEFNWKLYRSLIANEIENIILSQIDNKLLLNLKYSSIILDRLYQSFKNLKQENILFIEDNFYYSSMRHRYRQIAQRTQIGFLSIHLYSNITIALQRNQKRDITKRVSNNSIENIYSKYELSNDDLIIDTTDRGITIEHLNKILQRIEQACKQPEQCRIETEINQQTFIYEIDQKLRKFLSKYLNEKFSNNDQFKIVNEKKVYAEMINNKRQKFLELIKQKFILLNDNDDIEQIFQQYLQEILSFNDL